MKEIGNFVQRYVEVWNEPDPASRRRRIAEIWSENAIHYTETLEAQGHEAIEARITTAYEKFVATGEYAFKALNNAIGHNNAVRLGWVMVSADGGKPAASGAVFVLLENDGRILTDYQFTDAI